MNHADKRILRNIVLAKCGSDGAKGKPQLVNQLPLAMNHVGMDAYKRGYAAKNEHIRNALRDIARYHSEVVHFFVEKDDKKDNQYIVYFDIDLNGEKMQLSFHAFGNIKKWVKGSAGSIGRYMEDSPSRKNCLAIAEAICGSAQGV